METLTQHVTYNIWRNLCAAFTPPYFLRNQSSSLNRRDNKVASLAQLALGRDKGSKLDAINVVLDRISCQIRKDLPSSDCELAVGFTTKGRTTDCIDLNQRSNFINLSGLDNPCDILLETATNVMESVLDVVIRPALENLGHERPFRTHALVELTKLGIFLSRPLLDTQFRCEMIEVSLSALFPSSFAHGLGNVRPFGRLASRFDELHQLRVFLRVPRLRESLAWSILALSLWSTTS